MKKRFFWAFVIICMGIIFFFSSQNADESTNMSDRFQFLLALGIPRILIRKAAHFCEFALLGLLSFNAFYVTKDKFCPLISLAFVAIYAVSDEIHQIFVDGRACTVTDMLIDTCGGMCGILFMWAILYIFKRFTASKEQITNEKN